MLLNVLAFFFEGGPDENPRVPKTLEVAKRHFKKCNLDVLLISKRAPGLSAYNQVERRMASLNKAVRNFASP